MANEFAVGDILIGGEDVEYITRGKEYEVQYVSRRGVASVLDDDGDDLDAYPSEFTLKQAAKASYIAIESIREGEQPGTRIIVLEVDEEGAEAISDLIKETSKARIAKELREKIAELDAQLKAL